MCSSRRWVVYLTMGTHIVHTPWCPEPASELPYLLRTNQHPSRSLARTGRSHQSCMVSLSENTSGKHRRHAAAQAATATAATCTCTTTIAAPEAPQSPFPLRTDG